MTYICYINDNVCPLILKRHIYTFHISFICRIIFNAHVHVMYYKQPCRLQPTTSYHTVLGFPILARVLAQNFSKFDFIHVTFCVCLFRMYLLEAEVGNYCIRHFEGLNARLQQVGKIFAGLKRVKNDYTRNIGKYEKNKKTIFLCHKLTFCVFLKFRQDSD